MKKTIQHPGLRNLSKLIVVRSLCQDEWCSDVAARALARPGHPLAGQRLEHPRELRSLQAEHGRATSSVTRPPPSEVELPASVWIRSWNPITSRTPYSASNCRRKMRAVLGQIDIDENQQVPLGRQQRIPQRLAFALVGAQFRDDGGMNRWRSDQQARGRGPRIPPGRRTYGGCRPGRTGRPLPAPQTTSDRSQRSAAHVKDPDR
jgi:hypothetical protein